MLKKIKCIKDCINFLEGNLDDMPDNEGYSNAIEDLKSYLEDEKDSLEDAYNEHNNDHSF